MDVTATMSTEEMRDMIESLSWELNWRRKKDGRMESKKLQVKKQQMMEILLLKYKKNKENVPPEVLNSRYQQAYTTLIHKLCLAVYEYIDVTMDVDYPLCEDPAFAGITAETAAKLDNVRENARENGHEYEQAAAALLGDDIREFFAAISRVMRAAEEFYRGYWFKCIESCEGPNPYNPITGKFWVTNLPDYPAGCWVYPDWSDPENDFPERGLEY